MNFEELVEKMSIIKKLHTAREEHNKTIFYKKPYSAKSITIITFDKTKSFDLEKVNLLSVSHEGLLLQYVVADKYRMYPYPITIIKDVIVNEEI